MSNVIVLPGQKLIDIAMQELGDAAYLYELADYNDLLPSDDIQAGQTLELPEVEVINELVVRALQKVPPATIKTGEVIGQGVGFWRIEEDFIIA